MATSPGESLEKLEDMIVRAAETTGAHVRAAKAGIGTVIFGQDKVIDRALITVLCGGHALLVGVPGLAKTKLVDTMGTVLGLDARRIQFTPDLLPAAPSPPPTSCPPTSSAPRFWRKASAASAISASSPARSSPNC